MELQAAVQMRTAPDTVQDPALAEAFRQHLIETEEHARLMHDRLDALGASPSRVKDAFMKLGGKAFHLFAKAQPETPGRLVAHAYAYEAMECAGYALLEREAEICGDTATADVAREIQSQEAAMRDRLEIGFNAAEEASHGSTPLEDLPGEIIKHLTEAHALESQSLKLLGKCGETAGDTVLAGVYRTHLAETRGQLEAIEDRLEELGAERSTVKDTALKLGALNWNAFFDAQSDRIAKLAGFAYAVEHLEIAGYELLRRTAHRGNDTVTEKLAARVALQERDAARRIAEVMDLAAVQTLEEVLD